MKLSGRIARVDFMRPDQLNLLTTVSAPRVHPSGEWAVVATSRPDFAADGYTGQLWRVPLDGSAPRRITRGFADAEPRFSPDGTLLAFLRATQDGKPQLHVAPAAGGEPVVLSDRHLGVGEFTWTPDGARIVFVSREPAEGRYGTLDDVGPGQEDARHIRDYQFQMNGVGYTGDKRRHVFVVDVPDVYGEPPIKAVGRAAKAAKDADEKPSLVPAARQVTSDDADYADVVVTPDGNAIIVSASRHETRDEDVVADLYRVALDGDAEPERLTNVEAGDLLNAGTPRIVGDQLFFLGGNLGETGRDFVGRNTGVFVMPLAGGTARRLTDAESYDVTGIEVAGEGVLATIRHRGTAFVARLDAGGALSTVLDGPRVVAAAVPAGDDVVISYADATTTGDVGVVRGGELVRLTDFSAALREQTHIAEPVEIVATAPDGYEVHGWYLLPDGDGPFPVLFNIHGGPFADYTCAFFDEAQTYVEAGYAVLMCNPRGAAGYGERHGQAIKGDMGNLDMVDLFAFLDHAVATVPQLDGERLGVMGGSYGGYMTAWIIGHDHRFQGAIVERGFLDPRSFIGSSDIGWFFTTEYTTADEARMDAQSPMHLTGSVTTPTLVLHSEQDLRCPLSQALRYYAQLKIAGVDAELLVFPGETHELSRSGTPWHRRQRFEKILDWWARHLPVEAPGA